MQWFQQTRLLEEGQRSLRLGNGDLIHVRAVGSVILRFENKRTLFLSDCLFVPDFKRNLVSVSCLIEQGFTVQFNSSIYIRSSTSVICSGDLLNGLYYLSLLSYDVNNIEIVDDKYSHIAKKKKTFNETYL